MEILKIAVIILIFSIFSNGSFAQTELSEAFSRSYTSETNGKYTEAIEEIRKHYNEDSYEINIRLGWLHYQAGLFSESLTYYQKSLTIMPFSEQAKFGSILPAAALGKWDYIINQYNKILSINPHNTTANYRLGLIYYGKKDFQKSLDLFKRVVDLYPFDYDALIILAWTHFQLGKNREAKVLFNRVLLLSPTDASALEGLKQL